MIEREGPLLIEGRICEIALVGPGKRVRFSFDVHVVSRPGSIQRLLDWRELLQVTRAGFVHVFTAMALPRGLEVGRRMVAVIGPVDGGWELLRIVVLPEVATRSPSTPAPWSPRRPRPMRRQTTS